MNYKRISQQKHPLSAAGPACRTGGFIGFLGLAGIHLFAEVLIKNKPQDVVPEIIGIHFPAQGIGYSPEQLFEFSDMSELGQSAYKSKAHVSSLCKEVDGSIES